MDWDARTLLRGFLLIGGLLFVGVGLVRGEPFDVGIGAFAAVLGGFGLWYDRRSAGPDEQTGR